MFCYALWMQTINQEALTELRELDEDGSDSTLKELVQSYFENMPQRFQKLEAAITASDFVLARKEAHSIRSSSLSLGAEKLSQLAYTLEYETADATPETFKKLTSELVQEYAAVKAELKKICRI